MLQLVGWMELSDVRLDKQDHCLSVVNLDEIQIVEAKKS